MKERPDTQEGEETSVAFEALNALLKNNESNSYTNAIRSEFSFIGEDPENIGHVRLRLVEKFSAEELDATPEYWDLLGKPVPDQV